MSQVICCLKEDRYVFGSLICVGRDFRSSEALCVTADWINTLPLSGITQSLLVAPWAFWLESVLRLITKHLNAGGLENRLCFLTHNIMQDEFCTYMHLEYRATEECVARSKQAAFTLPATIKTVCHGVPVAKIHSIPDDTILTVQEDGSVCCWSPGLQLQKTKSVFVCFKGATMQQHRSDDPSDSTGRERRRST